MQRTLLSMPMIVMMFMTLALCQNKGSIIMSEKKGLSEKQNLNEIEKKIKELIK